MAFRMAPAIGLFVTLLLVVTACMPAQNNRATAAAPRATAPAAVRGDDAMPRSQLVQVQAYLQALGYLRGRPDGIVGSRTRTAIVRFQRSSGLTPDGYYTYALLEALETSVDNKPAGRAPAATPAPSRPVAAAGGGAKTPTPPVADGGATEPPAAGGGGTNLTLRGGGTVTAADCKKNCGGAGGGGRGGAGGWN